MTVRIPTLLHSYTGGRREVEASGSSVGEVMDSLDRVYPGLRFRVIDEQDRIRQHMLIFVNGKKVEELSQPLGPADQVQILGALSGG